MMKTPDGPAVEVHPRYVTTGAGQLRVWRAGSGPNLVVLPGLVMSAAVTARAMAQAHPGWTLTVVELPGIGGSAQISPENPVQVAAVIHEGLAELGIHDAALLAHDLSAPIANALARRWPAPARLILQDSETARQWVAKAQAPAALKPREDGTHLSALWTHFTTARCSTRPIPCAWAGVVLRCPRHKTLTPPL
ncbi:alpha/beta hydrolase [Polaromonas sp. P1-6]|nr:alpha/beta hydrolase [Polaromonas sp. P1-6]